MELIKALTKDRQDRMLALYRTAFPKSEQKPFDLIVKKQEEGLVDMLSLEEDQRTVGLAIMARTGDLVLFDYFAVEEGERNSGRGTRALQAILTYYGDLRVVGEIDSTRETGAADLEMRIRRKAFYLRNGLTELPYQVNLWGNQMEMLSNNRPCSFEEYLDIYTSVFGPATAENIRLLAENPEKTEE